jgi:hypothetical protein
LLTFGGPLAVQAKLAFYVAMIVEFASALDTGPRGSSSMPPMNCGDTRRSGSLIPKRGRRWSCRASDFKKFSIRSTQAHAAFSEGIVLTNVFMGVASSEMRERAVYAEGVFSVWPVVFAEMTKMAKVAQGAKAPMLFPKRDR